MNRKPVVPFQATSPMMVIGLTNCRKTHWINQLLKNDKFTQSVSSISYCYGVYQDFFNKMDPNILCPIEFNKGLPSLENIDALDDVQFHMIILDDLMEKIVQLEDMRDLFTMYCHHKNITAIMVYQNPFLKGKHLCMISINTHIHILFRNKRDESQINHLAHQLFQKGNMRKNFIQVVDEELTMDYGYLVMDFTPKMPHNVQVCTNSPEKLHTCGISDSFHILTSDHQHVIHVKKGIPFLHFFGTQ